MDVNGAAAVVTGGGSGIGEASARAVAKLGARCVVLDRNQVTGEAVASSIGGVFVEADVAGETAVQVAMDAATELGPSGSW